MQEKGKPSGAGTCLGFRAGNAECLASVRRTIFWALTRSGLPRHEIPRLVEETLGEIWMTCCRCASDDQVFLRCVRRKAWNAAQRRKRQRHPAPLADVYPAKKASPELWLLRRELRRHIAHSLRRMTKQERMFAVLRLLRGVSLRNCAAHMGVSYHRARALHLRVGSKLRRDLRAFRRTDISSGG